MLFNSVHFVLFFPVVCALYFLLPARFRWFFLLAASYYFYMCWEAKYGILLATSTLIDYVAAMQVARAERVRTRRLWLAASLVGNFGILFSFKYLGFAANTLDSILSFYGMSISLGRWDGILLPIGISFYTFQSVSYTIDVYMGEREPERHLGKFALYVSFFPQLVAGPIERSTHLLPQFSENHRWDPEQAFRGLLQMGVGFFKKLVIADRLALYVDTVYGTPAEYGGLPFVICIYAFTWQVYADFSGYSDIAIGAARIMGYDLRKNFDAPFHSRTVAEFWRRWHISLYSWFRDYIFIPLGGSRTTDARRYLNVLIVFGLSGLWHGAAWTFVLFGLLHGVYIIVGDLTRTWREPIARFLFPGRLKGLHHIIQVLVTFHCFALSLILFRSSSLADAWLLVSGTLTDFNWHASLSSTPLPIHELPAGLVAVVLLEAGNTIQQRTSIPDRLAAAPWPVKWTVAYIMLFGILVAGVFTSNQFVYFQF